MVQFEQVLFCIESVFSLKIVYSILRSHTAFDEVVDLTNQRSAKYQINRNIEEYG